MEEFKKGEIVLCKNYTEETDWSLGIYIEYDRKGYDDKHHKVSPCFTQISENTFSIDKCPLYKRYIKRLPNINFGKGVIWGEQKEEHAN